ncbi:MAG: amino acid permease [Pseudomonadota bacterium]
MTNKIGFWSVLALVVGSQIGSAVFMLPASLAPFGIYSLAGWAVSAFGAIALAVVFADLCFRFPKTGGPHVYIEHLFGRNVAFFTGWTYWVVSSVSSAAVIVAAVSYLAPFIGTEDPMVYLFLEILLLLVICMLNLFGVAIAGRAEVLFTILKFLPLFIVPVAAISFFDSNNFTISQANASLDNVTILAKTTLLTLWGFIGIESATTPAGSVKNAKKTIPRAVIIGTLIVASIYIFNSITIMGVIPGAELEVSKAPYVDVAQRIFGGHWHMFIAVAASIVCIGTLNAWVLVSGQISLGLAEDKMLPSIFAKRNKYNAPYFSIILSSLSMVPLLILTSNNTTAGQVAEVIDFSVTSFLFIYLLCSLVNLVLSFREKRIIVTLISLVSVIFCTWVIYKTPITTIGISSLFTISGAIIYFFWYRKTLVKTGYV